MSDNRIIIGGFSCRLPNSDTPEQLWQHLLDGTYLPEPPKGRWQDNLFDIPNRFGQLRELDRFDASFFEVPPKQAHKMDPQLRLLLEVSYEAMIDAGFNPTELRGSRTGVFVGAHSADSQGHFASNLSEITGYEITGCSLNMFSNRLSFFYDFHGPSQTIDTACSSSMVALDAAFGALKSGRCDYAIVGGSNLILRPGFSLGFKKLQMLSPDGLSRPFDERANGYVRAEAVTVLLLTTSRRAHRRRAQLLATGVNSDGYTREGITFPSAEAQAALLKQVYHQAGIDPARVSYVEAHGTGTQAGDPQEVAALDAVIASRHGRGHPLLIGSVKSNIGHCEGASGLAGMTKLLLALEKGIIPANIHYERANPAIDAIAAGRIEVVDQHRAWPGGLASINSFGFGGTNAHAVLAAEQQDDAPSSLPRAVQVIPYSARTREGRSRLEQQLGESSADPVALGYYFRRVSRTPVKKHGQRGARVVDRSGNTLSVDGSPADKRPVWFVFTGMGAQWPAMGRRLLKVPALRRPLLRCADALEQVDLDLLELLCDEDEQVLHDVLHSFVCLTAIQIAFVDALYDAGIQADGMFGHSQGEIPCAYADGAITCRQAMQIAYQRGVALHDPCTAGAMAVVRTSWEDAQAFSELGVYPACHNAAQNVTLAGRADAIERLIAELEARGMEVRAVDSSGIAFHSPHLDPTLPHFRSEVERIVAEPRQRSERWISTCLPPEQAARAPLCDADYFVANLRNPVLFNRAVAQIPSGATVIEIGAHTLFRATLLEDVPECRHVGLSRRSFDNEVTFYSGLAQLYAFGHDLDWQAIYPQEEPSRVLPELPRPVDWDHGESWEVASYERFRGAQQGGAGRTFDIDLRSDELAFIRDHVLNNTVVFPGVGYLYLVWQTVAQQAQLPLKQLPIRFQDVHFHRATSLPEEGTVKLTVNWLRSTEHFEITEGEDLVASGNVSIDAAPQPPHDIAPQLTTVSGPFLGGDELYKELRLRGYDYGPAFKKVDRLSIDGCQIDIAWDGNWVGFLDCLLHSSIVRLDRCTVVPTYIRELQINPAEQPATGIVSAYSERHLRHVRSRAVTLDGAKFTVVSAKRTQVAVSEQREMRFAPYVDDNRLAHESNEELRRYARAGNSFTARSALQLLGALERKPNHLLRLERLLQTVSWSDQDADRMEQYLDHPRAFMARLAHHLFAHPEQLLRDPMELIVSFPDYYQAYRHDLISAYLLEDGALDQMVQLVRENRPFKRPLSVCELGAGTGGLTANLLPLLEDIEDRYLITDVSRGFFSNLQQDLAAYEALTRFATWDINAPAPQEIRQARPDLVVASNALHVARDLKQSLRHIGDVLEPGAFLLLHENTNCFASVAGMWGFISDFWQLADEQDRSFGPMLTATRWKELVSQCGLEALASTDDGVQLSLILCRKPRPRRGRSVRVGLDPSRAEAFETLKQHLNECAADPEQLIWLEGNEVQAPGLVGLFNCARKEPFGDQLRCLYVEGERPISDEMRDRALQQDLALNVIDAEGRHGSYRHAPWREPDEVHTDNAFLEVANRGDLSSVRWVQAPSHIGRNYDFEPHYCGLNFKDVMLASGKLPPNALDGPLAHAFGSEFSGFTRDGRRVMGFLNQSLHTKISVGAARPPFIWSVPDGWSLEQAATVTTAYMTAYLALELRAQLRGGERVLIHTGSGGVGQAALRIALAKGCEVFTTVGTPQKRAFIRETFPSIDDDHIASSRDCAFEQLIMNATSGEGVDVVLNSLADEKLQASLRVLARFGKFLEIGKYDMSRDTPIGMELLLKDRQVHGVGINNVMLVDNGELVRLNQLLDAGIAAGVVQPLPSTVFALHDFERALRFMAQGKHIGKVVVQLRDGAHDASAPFAVRATKRFWCSPDRTYLVTGGLGGVGLELCDWLVDRGARRLVITSRRGVRNGYQRYLIETWKRRGVEVLVSTRDISSADETAALFDELARGIAEQAPLGGIFHLAMVLRDAFLANQTHEAFDEVCRVKLAGARNLDTASRRHADTLEHFVVFSSLVGGAGNPSQSAYGYANFAVDQLCRRRNESGLPGVAIQWGAIGDVGFYHDNHETMRIEGMKCEAQPLHSCLQTLERFLCSDRPVVASYAPERTDFSVSRDTKSAAVGAKRSFATLLADFRRILGIAPSTALDTSSTMMELGVDSLMGVELVQKLERDYDIRVPLAKVREMALDTLRELLDEQEQQAHPAVEPTAPTAEPSAAHRALPLFDQLDDGPIRSRVTYFVSGILADPSTPLRPYRDRDTTLFIVRYEEADGLAGLIERWAAHIDELPQHVALVRIVGYSAGAAIVHQLGKDRPLDKARMPVLLATLSPPRTSIFDPLQVFSLEQIEKTPDDQMVQQLRRLSVWGDYAMLPLQQIRKQMLFLRRQTFYYEEPGKVDQIVLPKDDVECWSEEHSRTLANQVVTVPGTHDLRRIDLTPFL